MSVSKFPTEEKLTQDLANEILSTLNKYNGKADKLGVNLSTAVFLGVLDLCKEAVMQEVRGGE